MHERKGGLRAVVSSAVGSAVFCGVLALIAARTGAAWMGPGGAFAAWFGGSAVGSWAMTALLSFSAGFLYTSWFDELFAGSGPVRGLKFGIAVSLWTLLAMSLAQGYGVAGLGSPRPALYVSGLFLAWIASGCATGTTYGGTRARGEYLYGLGYGVSDRRSIV